MLKSCVKEKIMKKNKVEFVSAEFNVCLLGSPFIYDSGVV